MLHRLAVALACIGATFACSDDTTIDSECGRGAGVVELGQGGSRLRDLPASGGDLQIVRGSQGGIHVLVGFRVRDMDLTLDAVYRLVDAGTREPVGTDTTLALRPALFTTDGVDRIRNPDLVILNNEDDDPSAFDGRAVVLELEAVNRESHACDAREVVLRAPM